MRRADKIEKAGKTPFWCRQRTKNPRIMHLLCFQRILRLGNTTKLRLAVKKLFWKNGLFWTRYWRGQKREPPLQSRSLVLL